MNDVIATKVKENISGLCDSYVLHLACVATDNDFIEMARRKPSCILAVHRASDRVCPEAVRKDSRFLQYLIGRVEWSLTFPTRQYLVAEFQRLDSRLNREYLFSMATLSKPSAFALFRWPVLHLLSMLGFDTRSRYGRFVQDHINAETIDKRIVYEEILAGLTDDGIPAKYRDGVAAAFSKSSSINATP